MADKALFPIIRTFINRYININVGNCQIQDQGFTYLTKSNWQNLNTLYLDHYCDESNHSFILLDDNTINLTGSQNVTLNKWK